MCLITFLSVLFYTINFHKVTIFLLAYTLSGGEKHLLVYVKEMLTE